MPPETKMPLRAGGVLSRAARVAGRVPCSVISTGLCSRHVGPPARSAPYTAIPAACKRIVPACVPVGPSMSSEPNGTVITPRRSAIVCEMSTREAAGKLTSALADGRAPDGQVAGLCQLSNAPDSCGQSTEGLSHAPLAQLAGMLGSRRLTAFEELA